MVKICHRNLVCGFVIFLGVMLALKSPMLVGKIFGGALSVLFLAAAVYLFVKIKHSARQKFKIQGRFGRLQLSVDILNGPDWWLATSQNAKI